MLTTARVAALLALIASIVVLAGRAEAHDQTPSGAAYCGQVNLNDSVSLEAFARHVSCHYARQYARWCLHGRSLHGWRFHGEQGYTGRFRLTRGRATLWLDDAGGGAPCLAR